MMDLHDVAFKLSWISISISSPCKFRFDSTGTFTVSTDSTLRK